MIGMPGSGKSTIGAALAKALNYRFTDLDEYITQKTGKTIQQIIDTGGGQSAAGDRKEKYV